MAEIRRIVKNGGGVSVSMPSRFVKALGLKIGDHVVCEIVEGRIQIFKLYTAGGQGWVSQSEANPK